MCIWLQESKPWDGKGRSLKVFILSHLWLSLQFQRHGATFTLFCRKNWENHIHPVPWTWVSWGPAVQKKLSQPALLSTAHHLTQEDPGPPQCHICKDKELTSKMGTAVQSSDVVKDDWWRQARLSVQNSIWPPESPVGTARELNLLKTHYYFFWC